VDGPTGLDLTTGEAHDPVRARLTVTFGGVRRGHLLARQWCGRIVVVDIGFPAPDPAWPVLVTDRWARPALPAFRADMHKGDRGKVLVIGGDEGMAGAAIHAASAALVAGAGLVKLAANSATIRAATETLPDVLTLETKLGPMLEPELVLALSWADALVVGPGIGRSSIRADFVNAVLSTDKPAVVDADALQLGITHWAGYGPRVLTPHAGEFAAAFPNLAGKMTSDRIGAAEEAAARSGTCILLKGVPTVIAAQGFPSLVVAAGTPALATGGSGDVLAGFIGAFLAAGVPAPDAAALGAQALGRAAEFAAALNSARAVRPADVMAAVPGLWKRWAEEPRVRPPILLELDPPILA